MLLASALGSFFGCAPSRLAARISTPLPAGAVWVPAIVIGSGFGGAVASYRLAQAGIQTALLEQGRRWPIRRDGNTFAGRIASGTQLSDPRIAYKCEAGIGYPGLLLREEGNGITTVRGIGVGGGSLAYYGMTVEPRAQDLNRVLDGAVSHAELAPYYARARGFLNASPIPSDVLASEYFNQTRTFLELASRVGLPFKRLDSATNWNMVREEIAGKRAPGMIIGDVARGTNSGAKNSVDRSYIRLAEDTGNLRVMPQHKVVRVTKVSEALFCIESHEIDDSCKVVGTSTIYTPSVFFAAGSMGTSQILLQAKHRGDLPLLNAWIGKAWGTNGDALTGRIQAGGLTHPRHGGPACALIEDFDNAFAPVVVESIIGSAAPKLQPQQGDIPIMSMTLIDKPGEMAFDNASGRATPTFSTADNPNMVRATEATINRIRDRGGVTVVSGADFSLTAHPLGGAVIGKACDAMGRLHGYQGLYVVDGALFPGSTAAANPSLTITAMAERILEHVVPEVRARAQRG
jgi:cholesterol oxidase